MHKTKPAPKEILYLYPKQSIIASSDHAALVNVLKQRLHSAFSMHKDYSKDTLNIFSVGKFLVVV